MEKENCTVSLGFVYGSSRAHKAFWPMTMKNRGSLSPSSAPAIPDNIRPVGGRRPVGNGSGTEPRPRGFQFGAAGGWNLNGTDCPWWWGRWWRRNQRWSGRRVVGAALRAGEGSRGSRKLEVAAAGSEGVGRRPTMMSCSWRKVEFDVGDFVGGLWPGSLRT
jgi:hypothetical protein